MIGALIALLRRDLASAWAGGGGALLPLGFFLGTATLGPLAIGTEPERLAAAGPGLLWVALALASLLSAERLFQGELEEGGIDLLLLSGVPGWVWSLIKMLAHAVATGLPLVLATPLVWLMLRLPGEGLPQVLAAVALGSLCFTLIGGVAAALASGIRRGLLLMAVLALPLFAPIAIFGAGVAYATLSAGGAAATPLLLLAAMALASVAVCPFAVAAALASAAE
jgi:heme exporter protein B